MHYTFSRVSLSVGMSGSTLSSKYALSPKHTADSPKFSPYYFPMAQRNYPLLSTGLCLDPKEAPPLPLRGIPLRV